MTSQNIVKSSLILQYQFGEDSHGNPTLKKQRFTSIKTEASDENIKINTNNITNYKPSEFAELLNVSVKTLQRWDRDKILVAKRTPTNRRYYTYNQYLE